MSTKKTGRKEKTLFLAQNGVLAAIIILMAFTPVGYLKTGLGIEITFIMIPVAVGAIVLGEKAGAFLGLVFGISSFIQCFGMSPFGAALLQINPFYTFIMCIFPRVFMGYLCGLIYKSLSKFKNHVASFIASLSAPILNTLFFVGFLIILFGKSDYITEMRGGANIIVFFATFVGINGLLEIVVTAIISPPVTLAIKKAIKKFK